MTQFNFTPAQMIQMIKNGANPQQLMMTVLDNWANANPVYANLASLAKEGKTKEIEQIARNLAKERGLDFDKELQNLKNQMRM
jgi:hypothetical protein